MDGWLGWKDFHQSDEEKNVAPAVYPIPVIQPVNLLFQYELIIRNA
jgi:hypothetical protein